MSPYEWVGKRLPCGDGGCWEDDADTYNSECDAFERDLVLFFVEVYLIM